MSEDRQNVDTAAEPDEKGWEALRPAVKYPVAEGALDEAPAADSPQEDVQDTQPETQTGRLRASGPRLQVRRLNQMWPPGLYPLLPHGANWGSGV